MICIVSREVHSCIFFFFNQKTAYEVRISDWSSDVCSSDLAADHLGLRSTRHGLRGGGDSKRQHPRDSDEGSDHAPALLVGESKRGPGHRSLSRSTCLEIHVDRREAIPSDDTIDRKSTRLYSRHYCASRMSSSDLKKKNNSTY